MTERPQSRSPSPVAIGAYVLLAAALGGASAWPIDTASAWGEAAVHAAILAGALIAFLVLLPRAMSLPWQIFTAMILGIGGGWILARAGQDAFVSDYLGIFGEVFILMLKLVIIPLVFVTVLCGVAGIGDVRRLGALGAKTIGYFVCTTTVAVLIGLTLVNTLLPGAGRESLKEEVGEVTEEQGTQSPGERIQEEVLPSIIQNPIMAGQSPLVVIFFALLLGVALATLGDDGRPAIRFFQSLDKAFMTIIQWVMFLAPIGVFALMARVIAELGIDYVITLAKFCLTVFAGLILHFMFLTFIVGKFVAGVSPRRLLSGLVPAFELAFSTSSSMATLPVTRDCVTTRVGADRNIANFVLPIGATVNMDGTALYVSVASLFVAQVYGTALSFTSEIMVFLTAVVVSVGAAGIPGASIALITIILDSIGVPAAGIGIVIGVDRILDMSRTLVNVTGDAVGTLVISRSEGVLGAPEAPSPGNGAEEPSNGP